MISIGSRLQSENMATSIPTAPKATPAKPWNARVPFVSTSFATNLFYYAALWPLWWILGVDQLLLPFFILYEFVRFLITSNWQFRVNAITVFALLLAVWWVVPLLWVDRNFLDIFLKETATVWSQFFILTLFLNQIHTKRDWQRVVAAMMIIALYMVVTGLIYASGLWRGEIVSIVGRMLPNSLVHSSAFFSSIAYRHFGETFLGETGFFAARVISLTLSFSSLSLLCLLLIPMAYWQWQLSRSATWFYYGGLTIGLLVALVFTESRIAYAAFLAGVMLYIILRLHLLRRRNRPLTIAFGLAIGALALILGFIALGFIAESLRSTFIDLRPGSWLARFRIYQYTLQLLPQHLIAGWGIPVRIPGMASEYSAGTHSSYLGMLFQHGIIGLFLYLGLWLSIWRVTLNGLRNRAVDRSTSLFWTATAAAFFAFNIREIADTWWWDQSLLFAIWLLWGLVLTAPRVMQITDSHE